jgi:hypothetical protein
MLVFQKNPAFLVIIVSIFSGLLVPVFNTDFALATSGEGEDTGGGGDDGGGDNGGGGGDEPDPEPEPESEPDPDPDPGLVPGPEPPEDPCVENPNAEGCIPGPPIDPCIEDPTAEGCQPDPGFVGPTPQPMPPYEGCLLDPTLPGCVPITPPLTSPPVKSCHPSYPDTCIPGPPPNLNCGDVSARNFKVVGSDPHGFDGDNDGVGCEGSGSGGGGGGGGGGCDPSYPEDCIPPPPPDLNCGDSSVPNNVKVVQPDPHRLDRDKDGVGCEGGGSSGGGDDGNSDGRGSSSANECQGQADCFRGMVTEIVDGDTLDINNVRVRLALVNTPERGEDGYTEAIDFVQSICGVGTTALVDEDDGQKEGSFDRVIGLVYCGNDNINNKKSLNGLLLEGGYATIYQEFCGISEFSTANWAQSRGC